MKLVIWLQQGYMGSRIWLSQTIFPAAKENWVVSSQ